MENIIYVGVVPDQLFKKDYLSFFSFCYEKLKNKLEKMEFNDFIINDIDINPLLKKDINILKDEDIFFFDVKSININNHDQIIHIYSPFNYFEDKEINKLPCIFIKN